MNLFGLKPDDVFTPRSAIVNDKMYVNRDVLEQELRKYILGSRHIIVHGESGNGKTWLYKKVFKEIGVPYSIINLATASRLGSLQAAFSDKLNKKSPQETLAERVVTKTGGADLIVKSEFTDERIYKIAEREPLEALMALLSREARGKVSFIVLDNLEQILADSSLVKQLSDAIILLDDDDYAKYKVRFCIVGVPSDLRDYLAKQSSIETITNRTVELPEVARLSVEEARTLLGTGFELLKLKCSDELIEEMTWKTDRIAQHLHELGLEVALAARLKNSNFITREIFEEALTSWFVSSLTAVKEALDNNLNARDTKAGRRNQVIYALGCLKTEDFKYSDVEEMVRKEFPGSTKGVVLNVSQTLSQLEKSDHPLIKRVPKGDAYRMVNPKVKIAIRVTMEKTPSEKATRRPRFT